MVDKGRTMERTLTREELDRQIRLKEYEIQERIEALKHEAAFVSRVAGDRASALSGHVGRGMALGAGGFLVTRMALAQNRRMKRKREAETMAEIRSTMTADQLMRSLSRSIDRGISRGRRMGYRMSDNLRRNAPLLIGRKPKPKSRMATVLGRTWLIGTGIAVTAGAGIYLLIRQLRDRDSSKLFGGHNGYGVGSRLPYRGRRHEQRREDSLNRPAGERLPTGEELREQGRTQVHQTSGGEMPDPDSSSGIHPMGSE